MDAKAELDLYCPYYTGKHLFACCRPTIAQCIIVQCAISEATLSVCRISIGDICDAIMHLQIRENK